MEFWQKLAVALPIFTLVTFFISFCCLMMVSLDSKSRFWDKVFLLAGKALMVEIAFYGAVFGIIVWRAN